MKNPHSTLDCFLLHGGIRMHELADAYALDLGDVGEATLAESLGSSLGHLHRHPHRGDRITLGPAEFEVVDTDNGEIRTAGLRFKARSAEPVHQRSGRRPLPRHRFAFPWPTQAARARRRLDA